MNIAKLAFFAGYMQKDASVDEEVKKFLVQNPNPEDEQVHSFAESLGVEKDKVEEAIYRLASKQSRFVADTKKVAPEDKEDLKKGEEVEKEHTDDPEIAKKIASDHVDEAHGSKIKYYEGLEVLEKLIEKYKGKK